MHIGPKHFFVGKKTYRIFPNGNIERSKGSSWVAVNATPNKKLTLGTREDKTTTTLQQLLATAFIPNPDNCQYVGWKDRDKNNNSLDNLYWMKNTELAQQKLSTSKNLNVFKDEDVLKIRELFYFKGFEIPEITKIFHAKPNAIRDIVSGRKFKHLLKSQFQNFTLNQYYQARNIFPAKIDITTEKWKMVDGCDNKYRVSNYGKTESLRSGVWKELKQTTSAQGYKRVGLYKKGKQTIKFVHRLVAEAFVPNNNRLRKFINHLDFKKTNNKANNLCWVTATENMAHRFLLGVGGAFGENSGRSKISETQAKQVFNLIKQNHNNKSISKITGLAEKHVSAIRCGKIWTRLGFSGYIQSPKKSNKITFI